MEAPGENSKLVSIVMPLFNKASFVEATIKSIINQTYTQWECIVVDDGSTDESIEKAERLSKSDKRIKVYQRHRSPKGANTCRNIGIEKSGGVYIMFLDADDVLAEHCLQKRVEFALTHNDCDFWVFTVQSFRDKIENVKTKLLLECNNDSQYLRGFLRHELGWIILSALWSAKAISHLSGFNESLQRYQDVDFHIRALATGLKFKVNNSNHPDAYYRLPDVNRWPTNVAFRGKIIDSAIKLELMKEKHVSNAFFKAKKHGYRYVFFHFIYPNKYFFPMKYKAYIRFGIKYGYMGNADMCKLFLLAVLEKLRLHNMKYTGYYKIKALLLSNEKDHQDFKAVNHA